MNAKQEMLDLILDIDLDVEGRNVVGETVPHNTMRIRAILETHELVPVDSRPFDQSKGLRGAISDALDDLVSKEVISWTVTSPDPVAVDAVLSAVEGVLRLRGRDEN